MSVMRLAACLQASWGPMARRTLAAKCGWPEEVVAERMRHWLDLGYVRVLDHCPMGQCDHCVHRQDTFYLWLGRHESSRSGIASIPVVVKANVEVC